MDPPAGRIRRSGKDGETDQEGDDDAGTASFRGRPVVRLACLGRVHHAGRDHRPDGSGGQQQAKRGESQVAQEGGEGHSAIRSVKGGSSIASGPSDQPWGVRGEATVCRRSDSGCWLPRRKLVTPNEGQHEHRIGATPKSH